LEKYIFQSASLIGKQDPMKFQKIKPKHIK